MLSWFLMHQEFLFSREQQRQSQNMISYIVYVTEISAKKKRNKFSNQIKQSHCQINSKTSTRYPARSTDKDKWWLWPGKTSRILYFFYKWDIFSCIRFNRSCVLNLAAWLHQENSSSGNKPGLSWLTKTNSLLDQSAISGNFKVHGFH